MAERTRTGIETLYRGIRFRSRLEAKWACFFDLMQWQWEYEPFDAAGYIPDFVLLGADPVLVEVKPATSPEDFNTVRPRVTKALVGRWAHDILFVGVTPFLCRSPAWDQFVALGVLEEYQATEDGGGDWMAGLGLWNECGYCGLYSFFHDFGWYKSRLCGHHDGDHYLNDPELYSVSVKWAQAGNAAQWRP